MTPDSVLMTLIRKLTPQEAQNRLLSLGDRDLALAMMYFSDPDKEYLLGFLSPKKTQRIREELALQKHRRITYSQYRTAVEHVIASLSSAKNKASLKSYFRPFRSGED
jgi:hypothetical protein